MNTEQVECNCGCDYKTTVDWAFIYPASLWHSLWLHHTELCAGIRALLKTTPDRLDRAQGVEVESRRISMRSPGTPTHTGRVSLGHDIGGGRGG